MPLFYSASLLPALLIAMAVYVDPFWGWVALGFIVVAVAVLDELLPEAPTPLEGSHLITGIFLPLLLVVAHFGTLYAVIADGTALPTAQFLPVLAATGLYFGQVSNPNAHELIHRKHRLLFRLGMWTYVSMMFGHHTSAHRYVHHVHVGTPKDPNSARWGEGYYRFLIRAWIGSFRQGLAAEREKLRKSGRHPLENPYIIYLVGSVTFAAAAAFLAGTTGLIAYLALAGLAQSQLLLSDYVQHYGLRRRKLPSGKFEPQTARHSWNSPHQFSSAMMLNAPRHSDHHVNPARRFPELALPNAPMLPRALPVMSILALVPPLWRRVMDSRATHWSHRGNDPLRKED